MIEIKNIEPNVDLIEQDGREIYLVGTAHVSRHSAELVEDVIRRYQPDTVVVELDEPRYQSLKNPDRWKETDIFKVIKDGKSYVLMAQLALAGFQKKLGKNLDVKPGEEMMRAITVAEELGSEVVLADRDVKITLKRAWGRAGLWTMLRIFFAMISALFSSEEMSEEDIEKLKSSDALDTMVAQFSNYLPGVKEALVDERDQYLAEKTNLAPGKRIVSIVGAAHAPGFRESFGKDIDLERLEELPPPKRSLQALTWGVPVLIFALVAYGFVTAGAETSQKMVIAWVLANGILAAVGTMIALAHPLTILTAFVAAPITSLNPAIAAGWVCGLVEAYLRRPKVGDLETIADDITTVRGVWTNSVSRVLLVIMLANLGSSLGTVIGFGKIAALAELQKLFTG
jgi:pheromone shutdown-related protein TraB